MFHSKLQNFRSNVVWLVSRNTYCQYIFRFYHTQLLNAILNAFNSFVRISMLCFSLYLQQTNEQQTGYISFKNFTESKSHWTVSLLFFFLWENRRSEKNCREQLDSNCGLLWLNIRQTLVKVSIAHWKSVRMVFFLIFHLKEHYHNQEETSRMMSNQIR